MKEFNIDYAQKTSATVGNGYSVSVNIPVGSETASTPNIGYAMSESIPEYKLTYCQYCPFASKEVYLSLPAQVKCTLTDKFHFCDDTHCDVKEKLIPIKWIKEHLPKDEDYIRLKGYRYLPENDLMNIAYDKGFNDGWEAFRKAIIEEWEEDNEQI